jgi:hypothetical protein
MRKRDRREVVDGLGRMAVDPHAADIDISQFRDRARGTLLESRLSGADEGLQDAVGAVVGGGGVDDDVDVCDSIRER